MPRVQDPLVPIIVLRILPQSQNFSLHLHRQCTGCKTHLAQLLLCVCQHEHLRHRYKGMRSALAKFKYADTGTCVYQSPHTLPHYKRVSLDISELYAIIFHPVKAFQTCLSRHWSSRKAAHSMGITVPLSLPLKKQSRGKA